MKKNLTPSIEIKEVIVHKREMCIGSVPHNCTVINNFDNLHTIRVSSPVDDILTIANRSLRFVRNDHYPDKLGINIGCQHIRYTELCQALEELKSPTPPMKTVLQSKTDKDDIIEDVIKEESPSYFISEDESLYAKEEYKKAQVPGFSTPLSIYSGEYLWDNNQTGFTTRRKEALIATIELIKKIADFLLDKDIEAVDQTV